MSEHIRIGRKRNSRPTIGVFTLGWTQQGGQAFEVWQGMVAAAQDLDLNLLCFAGGSLHQWGQGRNQRQILAQLAVPELFDGIVTFEWWSSREAFERFYEYFRPLPVVNVMRFFEGYPGVGIDNYQDMLMLLSHLIEVHGYRRIAYTTGWANTPTQETRYRAYQDALARHGMPFDPALVLQHEYVGPGGSGEGLVRSMMDDLGLIPGKGFDAIVGFNDDIALETLHALQVRGVRVPYDVAVVGIDDIAAARISTPPLTTLSVPRYEMGYKAVELLLAQIEGKHVPMQTVLPSRLMARRSCGCQPDYIREVGEIPVVRRAPEQSFADAWMTHRGQVLAEMSRAVETAGAMPVERWAERLLEAFYAQLTGVSTDDFLPLLDDLLRHEVENARPVLPWQLVLSSLRRHMLRCLSDADNEILGRAAASLGQAQALLLEMEHLAQARVQSRALQYAELLRSVGQALTTAPILEALIDELVQWLPRLGIKQCYLSVYQDFNSQDRSRLLLAYDDGRRLELSQDDLIFLSSQLMPDSAWPVDRRYALNVEPLYIRQIHVGVLLLEASVAQWQVYESLRAQLSSALYSALLLQEYEQTNQALAREQYFMQTLMDHLPDHIYFKDAASRFIRISRSLAQFFGLDDPALAVGKSDFDFFTAEHARPAYETEQRIIQTGEPVLDLEERETWPDRPDTWALTSKFPLWDRQGNVVGTFGISRDITAQKHAEMALQEAYREAERRAFLLETVTELSTVASSLIDFNVLVQRVVDLAQERFGLYYVGLFLVEETKEGGKWAVLVAGTGEAGKKMVADGYRLEVGGQSMIGRCIATAQADIRQRIDEADVRFVNPLLSETRAEMALPLISRGEVIGALTIQSAQEGAFSQEDIAVFQAMANQVANAIANARLVETVQMRLREMEILEEVSTAVSSMFSLDYTLDATVRALSEEMAFTYIAINLIDREANEMRTLRGFGLAASLNGLVRPLDSLENDILMDIVRKQAIEVIDGWDDRFDREIWEKGGHQHLVRAYVPLLIRGETIGILEVGYDRRERPRITSEEVRLLRSIADRVAVAVENARLLDETRAYANRQAAIADISARMQQATDIEALMQITSRELSRVLNAARVYVRLGMPTLLNKQDSQ